MEDESGVVEFFKISVRNVKDIRKEVFVFGLHHSQLRKWEDILFK